MNAQPEILTVINNTKTHRADSTCAADTTALLRRFDEASDQAGAPSAVLLDYFDTVASRHLDGEYLKAVWSKRLCMAAGLVSGPELVHGLRVQLEAKLCEENKQKGFDDEFRFIEMCRRLYQRLPECAFVGNFLSVAEFTDRCWHVELTLEKQTQRLRPQTVLLLKTLKQRGIPVYIASDFYLGTRGIRELIKHHGLSDLIQGYFVSSDVLLAKRSGRLFGAISERLALAPERILMIGDNPISDGQMALQRGLRSIPIVPPLEGRGVSFQEQELSRIHERLDRTINLPGEIFPEISLALYFFLTRLLSDLVQQGTARILFISREGHFLRELFDSLQEQLFGHRLIRSDYLRISRRAVFLPSLGPLESEDFEPLFKQYPQLSVRGFLENCAFPDDKITELGSIFGEGFDLVQDNFASSKSFAKLKSMPQFQELYESERAAQRKALIEHIEAVAPTNEMVPLILVDVGWRGSIQDGLSRIWNGERDLRGFYLGLLPAKISEKNCKRGVLFDAHPEASPYYPVFAEFLPLYEILLGAGHPSVKRYDSKIKGIIVEDNNAEELKIHAEFIRPRQESIRSWTLAVSKFMLDHHHDDRFSFFEKCARAHSRMVFEPVREEVEFLQSVKHFENFGGMNFTSFAPQQIGLRKILANLRSFLSNPTVCIDQHGWFFTGLGSLGLQWLRGFYAAFRKIHAGAPGVQTRDKVYAALFGLIVRFTAKR